MKKFDEVKKLETEIPGLNVNYDEQIVEYDVNEQPIEILQAIELASYKGILEQSLLSIVKSSFMTALLKAYKKYVNPQAQLKNVYNAQDYCDNLKIVMDALKMLDTYKDIVILIKNSNDIVSTLNNQYDKSSHRNVYTMLTKLKPCYDNAFKIEKICCEDISKESFLKLMMGFNKKTSAALKDTVGFLEDANEMYLGDICNPELYIALSESFDEIIKCMDIKNLVEETKTNNDRKVSTSEKSASEIEREKTIARANDLYDQLRLDWMRDLESQVPYLSRDKYESFLIKFKKFNDAFEMPLVKTTSLGKAQEACTQINNLMNNISDISETAYSSFAPIEK